MARFFSKIILLLFAQIVLYSSCRAQDDSLVVKASCGSLRGRLEPVVNGLSVRQFLGVPYAEPPVDQLRFAHPKPAKKWDGIRDAVEFGPECPQMNMQDIAKEMNLTADGDEVPKVPQSEDCLSLNVYTPSHATAQDKLAVMVWIYGGGFVVGAGRGYDPSVLVALHDVIVVSINYRLGVLGFFNIPGTDVKGNYAMYDQIQSLKWVQQNIAAFGGDPDQVTIFGESAGGMSVSTHLLSPLSKGLFRRAIAQSGSSATNFTCRRVESTKALEIFSKILNCDVKDDKFMECFREKSVEDIIAAQLNVSYPLLTEDQFLTTITVDGEFLPDDPKTLLKERKVNKADVMMGLTANELAIVTYMIDSQAKKDGGFNMEAFKISARHTLFISSLHTQLREDAVVFEYVDHSDINNGVKLRQASCDIGTDLMFLVPAKIEANALAQTDNPVYFYVFDHTPHLPKYPLWLGSYHGLDLAFTFGLPLKMDALGDGMKFFLPNKFSDLEVGLSKYVMRLLTQFAKYGDPNSGDAMPVTWPRYNSTGHVHLRISMEPKVEHSLRERKVAFWNEFFPKLTGNKEVIDGGKEGGNKEEQKQKEEL